MKMNMFDHICLVCGKKMVIDFYRGSWVCDCGFWCYRFEDGEMEYGYKASDIPLELPDGCLLVVREKG